MARHKKMVGAEDVDPALDISSLIDVCFLLLIYFIVATTLVQERKLDMQMPGQSTATDDKKSIEPGLVRVTDNGTVYWGKEDNQLLIDSDNTNHELLVLVEALANLKTAADAVDATPVVQLWVEPGVPHQRVIDVLNALTKAGIKSVGLTNFKDDE